MPRDINVSQPHTTQKPPVQRTPNGPAEHSAAVSHASPNARFARDNASLSEESRAEPASDYEFACRTFDGHRNKKLMELANRTASLDTVWNADRPLSEAHNAHSTNTKEQMEEALESGANWLEGDIRTEINSDTLEMRHDQGHEAGDNLTLDEWLEVGKESGRGMKLDIKEGGNTPQILDQVEASGIPDDRLMFNLGDEDMARYGAEIRERFPNAILAINPPCDGDKLSTADVDRGLELAERFGQPVTFVARFDTLTDDAINRLQEVGPVSVWNAMGGPNVDNADEVADDLRERGVDGVVDIRETPDLFDKLKIGLEKGEGFLHDGLDRGGDLLEDGKDLVSKGWNAIF